MAASHNWILSFFLLLVIPLGWEDLSEGPSIGEFDSEFLGV